MHIDQDVVGVAGFDNPYLNRHGVMYGYWALLINRILYATQAMNTASTVNYKDERDNEAILP